MATRRHSPYRDNFELESLAENPDEPDSPLPRAGNELPIRKPRWAIPSSTRWQSFQTYTIALLKPRWTWRYVVFALLALYVFYCWAEGSPLLASKLPAYTGPHGVGTIDLEIPLEKPRKISETVFEATGKPAYELETVLFSLYYPAENDVFSRKRKHLWFPRPLSVTASGYTKVAHVDNFLMRGLFTFGLWAIGGSIEIPAEVDVPLLDFDEDSTEKGRGEADSAFPIVVFSHGTASTRTDYTQLCGELASRGVFCAAIEHRDGSGPGSIIQTSAGRRTVSFYLENELLSDPPTDTDRLKKEQLDFRQAEIEETIAVLRTINNGNGTDILKANTRHEGIYLKGFANRFNLSHLVVAGHSYGATGALQAVKGAPSKVQPAIGCIAFDPGKSSGQLNTDINIPLLVVHSNSWSAKHSVFFGRPHFDTVKDLVKGVKDRVGNAWFMTMLGTSHPSVTDAPLIEPILLSWTTGASIDVNDGVREYVGVTMQFIEFLQSGRKTQLLAEKVTHPEYGQDETEKERKKTMSKEVRKFWQIHVAPE